MDRIHPFVTGLALAWSALGAGLERVADWVDQLDWDVLGPPACVGGALLLVWALLACCVDTSNRRQVDFWAAFAHSGRWVALGAAVAPVVVWAATRR